MNDKPNIKNIKKIVINSIQGPFVILKKNWVFFYLLFI